MNTIAQAGKSPHPLMWAAGIAVILFSAAGIAAIMGWIPTSMGRTADSPGISEPGTLAAGTGAPPMTSPQAPAQPHSAPQSNSAPEHRADNTSRHAICAGCGVIESTREVRHKGEGSGVGAVGGAVVGGLLGNQIGSGRGNMAATAIGAVGGAVAGNEVEKHVKSNTSYEVTVRLDDGSSRVINEGNPPRWRTGDRVKIVGNAIQANP